MSFFRKIQVLVGLLVLFQTSLFAEIYKWKDKDGKTHFSEKKTKDIEAVEDIGKDKNKAFSDVTTLAATKIKEHSSNRHLVIVRPDAFWTLADPNRKTTSYYFGGDCVSPSPATFKEMQENHRQLLPRMSSMIDYIVSPIYKLNYSVSSSMKQPLYKNLARYENPLVLRFSLDDLVYHLCVTNLRRQYKNHLKTQAGSSPFDFNISEFDRRRAKITLRWSLQDANTREILFDGTTSGSSNYWNKDIRKFRLNVIKDAMENATTNLLADETFVELLREQKVKTKSKNKKKSITKIKEKSFLDSVNDAFSSKAIRQSKFAKVLSEASTLKIMMMQFYQMEGRWPNNINELGTSRVAVFDENFVTQIQFDYDGSMVLNLDSDNFEHDAMISLQPIDKGMRVEWKCVTNLDDSYRGSFCQSVE